MIVILMSLTLGWIFFLAGIFIYDVFRSNLIEEED